MEFTKRLHAGIQRGEITCSIRIWMRPRVTPGHRYRLGDGEVEVDSIQPIQLAEITPALARQSGFASVVDLLKTAQHGRGTNVYLVRFHHVGRRPTQNATLVSGKRQRARILAILKRLPEAQAIAQHSHLSLEVRKRRFGYYLDDHHGDGRIALVCKSTDELRDLLQQQVPTQLHVPKYVGKKGWIGLWLDVAKVDWSVAKLALHEAYGIVAPKSLTRTS